MHNLIIVVGRQLGSGGRTIAQLLAREFQAKLYDRELLNLAARESGFSERYFEEHDEKKSLLRSLSHIRLPQLSGSSFYAGEFSPERLFQFQSDAISKAAAEGNCVFVGRCADYVLRNHPRLVSIFVSAPMEQRIQRVMEHHQCDARKAERIIRNKENKRREFYNYYTGRQWGEAANYHLSVDASLLGEEKTAEWIAEFIRQKYPLSDDEKINRDD